MTKQNINNGISVIILTWNSEKYIEKCIDSLIIDLNFTERKYEIFIIDNGSVDNTLAMLKTLCRKYEQIFITKSEKNLGTTISRNLGLKKSQEKYIFILDSDTEVKKGTIGILIDTIDKENKAGIVAPRIFYPDGAVQHSCKKFPIFHMKILKFLPFNSIKNFAEREELYKNTFQKEDKKIKEVDYCISAAWMVTRKALEEVGLFDEKIFYSPEDVDYCVRMWLKGWKIFYQPSAKMIHFTQRKSYTDIKIAWKHFMGLLYYFRKYNYWFNRRKLYRKIKNENVV